LIESTANQVNQFGGYTGQKPADFAASVRKIADSMQFPFEKILLGADHLGPYVWRRETAREAMEKAYALARDSILAGYTKIHLDCSMPCADDTGDRQKPLADEIVSERAAQLCAVAESAHRELSKGSPAPLYVIGTEVPIPGGELNGMHAPETTRAEDLERTLTIAKHAFLSRGLAAAWERVVAVVVQPGVEFGDTSVHAYDSRKARELKDFSVKHWHGVYEAHSTDYQSSDALRQLVNDHFAVLKVGPWLTYAFREVVFGLADAEEEWLAQRTGVRLSGVREALERAMIENPEYWQDYYQGDEGALRFARQFSYSDRARYYWAQPRVAAALERLLANLTTYPAPDAVLRKYLPRQAELVRQGQLEIGSASLIRNKIQEVLEVYAKACGTKAGEYGTC
jgi:D-tagatose-1,6-bisphosphate aldolase subunit GatZ/KbaZ